MPPKTLNTKAAHAPGSFTERRPPGPQLGDAPPVPTVVSTALLGHAVDPDDAGEPLRPQPRLVPVDPGVYNHPHLDGGYTITNAFPITVSSGT